MHGHTFSIFNKQPVVKHFVSSRVGGVSVGKYASLNLSLQSGDTIENVLENRSRIAAHFKIKPDNLVLPLQEHTNNVVAIKGEKKPDLSATDGLITNSPNICIGVLAADCVPILLFDPVQKVVGALHAGWKGTVQNIVGVAVEKMISRFKCLPESILAGIGPSISQKNYETGAEVIEKVAELVGNTKPYICNEQPTGKACLDLWKLNRQLLVNVGVQAANIELAGVCTYDNEANYFSARRDGFHSGRFGSFIMIAEM